MKISRDTEWLIILSIAALLYCENRTQGVWFEGA